MGRINVLTCVSWAFLGSKIPEKDRCKACKGEKTIAETKMLEVHISPGMVDGQKLVFRGESDQEVSLIYAPLESMLLSVGLRK